MFGTIKFITGFGRVKIVGEAKNVETRKTMIIFAPVGDNGFVSDTYLLNKEDFMERIIK